MSQAELDRVLLNDMVKRGKVGDILSLRGNVVGVIGKTSAGNKYIQVSGKSRLSVDWDTKDTPQDAFQSQYDEGMKVARAKIAGLRSRMLDEELPGGTLVATPPAYRASSNFSQAKQQASYLRGFIGYLRKQGYRIDRVEITGGESKTKSLADLLVGFVSPITRFSTLPLSVVVVFGS